MLNLFPNSFKFIINDQFKQSKQSKRSFILGFTLFLIITIVVIPPASSFDFDFDFDDDSNNHNEGVDDNENGQLLESKIRASRVSNNSLLWGTYRPNLYFGTRPRLPESLMSGLMWYGVDNNEAVGKLTRKTFL